MSRRSPFTETHSDKEEVCCHLRERNIKRVVEEMRKVLKDIDRDFRCFCPWSIERDIESLWYLYDEYRAVSSEDVAPDDKDALRELARTYYIERENAKPHPSW